MTDFDPTTIQIPFGMLTPEEQAVLKEWPHGWQIFGVDGWADRPDPTWFPHLAHRGKPAAVVNTSYYNVYLNNTGGRHGSILSALNAALPDSIGMICIDIVDGKLKDVREVKEDDE